MTKKLRIGRRAKNVISEKRESNERKHFYLNPVNRHINSISRKCKSFLYNDCVNARTRQQISV